MGEVAHGTRRDPRIWGKVGDGPRLIRHRHAGSRNAVRWTGSRGWGPLARGPEPKDVMLSQARVTLRVNPAEIHRFFRCCRGMGSEQLSLVYCMPAMQSSMHIS